MTTRLSLGTIIAVLGLTGTVRAATFTVTNNLDAGAGSLRDAIEQSNANGVADTITFALAVKAEPIILASGLPNLTEGRLTINGDLINDGSPDIGLDAAALSGTVLQVRSPSNTIRGLRITRAGGAALALNHPDAQDNRVVGCFLGTDKTGELALGNNYGVLITNGARNNRIGDTGPNDGNVISGNHLVGVLIAAADGTRILGNLIGVSATGEFPLGNGTGVLISDSEDCRVGNGTEGGRNVIGGNDTQVEGPDASAGPPDTSAAVLPFEPGYGVFLLRGGGHLVAGNHIGTNAAGTEAVRNGRSDVLLRNTVNALIGGTGSGSRNVLQDGIQIEQSRGATVQGNNIGVDATGNVGLDGEEGLWLWSAVNCTIGGSTAGARNVISGHRYREVGVQGGRGNRIHGNFIGLNRAGTQVIGGESGVDVEDGARSTEVGGSAAGTGNVFAGMARTGVEIDNGPGTIVQSNLIGFSGDGSVMLPMEASEAIVVRESAVVGPITIGGTQHALGNRIAVTGSRTGIDVAGPAVTKILANRVTGVVNGTAGTTIGITVGGFSDTPTAPRVASNTLTGLTIGLDIRGTQTAPVVTGNQFSLSGAEAIFISNGAFPNLGDLGNAASNDNGANVFQSPGIGAFDVRNHSTNGIKAEGNDWGGETVGANINATHVFDKLDNASFGLVDFDPLIGGSSPSSAGGGVTLTGLAAVPASRGAEIVFALSGPAEVQAEVLNIAGRPVALLPPTDGQAGLNRLAWSGLSAQGTAAPSGVYLVRLTARASSGAQASALTSVRLSR
ncbi:MAG: hypothetical protein FJX74_14020 [Armatimonadetes bacterium]|nr:hypothetical protein [Armatimonadota bacterium]